MNFELRKLAISDDMDIYEMLQEIPKDENGFINTVNGMTFEEYKKWLVRSDAMSKGMDWRIGRFPQVLTGYLLMDILLEKVT